MEYSATIFNDYSKLYLDECDTNIPWKWRAVFFSLVFPPPPPPPTKFALHIFLPASLAREFSSVHLSIQYHSIAENAEHVADRIYIVGTNASQITKIRKAIQHFVRCDTRYYFRRKESGMVGIASITFDRQRWTVFNDSDRSAER